MSEQSHRVVFKLLTHCKYDDLTGAKTRICHTDKGLQFTAAYTYLLTYLLTLFEKLIVT